METLTAIISRKIRNSRIEEIDFDHLEFGKYVSDHMLVCDFAEEAWGLPRISPYENLSLAPATLALHYGQTVFEGMKAFRMDDDRINIFRIERHYERFNRSLDRMCMPTPPKEMFIDGLRRLVEMDNAWVPRKPGAALYIRPFIYASETRFGVKVSEQYRFVVFTGPVPELYQRPIRIKVETEYIRAAKGGTGYAKCGGNYGASYYPTQIAKKQGYDQLLWTDARDHAFIEESGMMNAMFVINDKIVTPPVSDSILDGITRESLLILANDMGFGCEERPVSVAELQKGIRDGSVTEAFGAGTAAVVAPIELIYIAGTDYHLPAYHSESRMNQLKRRLDEIRSGKAEDVHNWNYIC